MEGVSDEGEISDSSITSDIVDEIDSQTIPFEELKELCDEIGVIIPDNYVNALNDVHHKKELRVEPGEKSPIGLVLDPGCTHDAKMNGSPSFTVRPPPTLSPAPNVREHLPLHLLLSNQMRHVDTKGLGDRSATQSVPTSVFLKADKNGGNVPIAKRILSPGLNRLPPALKPAPTTGNNVTSDTPLRSKMHHVDMRENINENIAESPLIVKEEPNYSMETNANEITRSKVCTPTTREKRKRIWKRNSNKYKRMSGETYVGFTTVPNPVTDRRLTLQNVQRECRKMGPPCKSNFCIKRKSRYCSDFSNSQRLELYNNFWKNMDWGEKKAHVRSLVDQIKPRHTKKETSRRRAKSYAYFLKLDGRRTQVCHQMFLDTLGMRREQIKGWLEKANEPKSMYTNSNGGYRSFYKEFLASIEKMTSHYCRQRTSKQYLEILFRTKLEVYNAYKSECLAKAVIPASVCTFCTYFRESNFDLHQPKKDMCDTCSSYKEGNVTKENYDIHQAKKESARAEKSRDKELAMSGKVHVITMDVQKVLLSPMLNASALYYKTKLIVHNFTVYDLVTHVVTCYLFDETEADLSSSSFATCLISFFEEHYTDDLPIIVYSDGCTNQNRNGFLSSALLQYSSKCNKVVMQKYLEKGHTQMEVDSVHALIEKKIRGRQIYVPTDYIKICLDARKLPQPYNVIYMNHADFKDYSILKYNIRPGTKKGDSVVTNVRQLKYDPSGKIYYKVDHREDWRQMPREYRVDSNMIFPQLYEQRLPLTEKKFKDLQDLLHVIPKCHHDFYKSLPCKKS